MESYYQKNKDKIIERSKLRYINNKEHILLQKRDYYKNNRDAKIEYQKNYYLCPEKRKAQTIHTWKKLGIVSEDYNELYTLYVNTDKCESCECHITRGRGLKGKKHLDHDHETGLFRNILCGNCNIKIKN